MANEITKGLGTALGYGAGALMGGGNPGFAEGFGDQMSRFQQIARENELMREQRRMEQAKFVQQLALTNPQIFAQLPEQQREPMIRALGETFSEGGNVPLDQGMQTAEQYLTQLGQPKPVDPNIALGVAQLGNNMKNPSLVNEALMMIHPEFAIDALAQEGVDPQMAVELAMKLMPHAQEFEPDSLQAFLQSNLGGAPDLTLLNLRPPEGSGTLPDFENVRAHEGYNLLNQGISGGMSVDEAAAQLNPTQKIALLKKMGQLPKGLDSQFMVGKMMEGLSIFAFMAAMSDDPRMKTNLDAAASTFSGTLNQVITTLEADGLYSPKTIDIAFNEMMTAQSALKIGGAALQKDLDQVKQQATEYLKRQKGGVEPLPQEVEAEVRRRAQLRYGIAPEEADSGR